MEDMPTDPPIVVHPPQDETHPYRRVEISHVAVGRAFNIADVIEFARRAGLDENFDATDPDLVKWRGGGPEDWSTA